MPEAAARIFLSALLATAGCLPLSAQAVSAPAASAPQAPAVAPTEALRPVLGHIDETVAGLSVGRWKAPGSVRSVAQRDADSIQRDIDSTLPPLMGAASAAPASVADSFAVYRNVDALYDVLLRVAETATLAGSQSDADNLQSALTSLEAARHDLGDSILRLAQGHERELIDLRTAVAQAAASAPAKAPAPVQTVVDDGPAPSSKTSSTAKKKKKKAPAAAGGSSAAPTGPSLASPPR